jgi:hypothetical protein
MLKAAGAFFLFEEGQIEITGERMGESGLCMSRAGSNRSSPKFSE